MITHLTRVKHYLFVWVSLYCVHATANAGLPTAQPKTVGLQSERLNQIDALVQEGLTKNLLPGCVVMVGRRGHIAFHRAYGHRQLEPAKVEMTIDTVFDMASITKPVATATSVMVLLEQGKIRLRDRVSTYIPDFANSGKSGVTVRDLLTHQAGFIPDNAIDDYRNGRKQAFENIYQLATTYEPRTRFVYSDVGFILLDDLIERQSGLTVHAFSSKHIFDPLGMNDTGYLPSPRLQHRAATTEKRESGWMRGEVHDPRAYLMDGVAGHAGLFSTAADIACYAQMMLNGGHFRGKRILSKATIDLMTRAYRIEEGQKVSIRGLGWDKLSGYSSNRAENMSDKAFGHGGFTGTVLWIDPELDLFFVFLSNRVHPNGKGSVNRLAGRIATVAVSAIDDALLGGDETATTTTKTSASSGVLPGIDSLVEADFAVLKGQRVGLITNQTGIDSMGRSTIELLRHSSEFELCALFSPEHGLAGKLDQSLIDDSVDGNTGLKVFSLYGKSRKPTAEQLRDIDTLVFDIQDIGCRFYTYISTLGLAMQAAAEHGKKLVVLDRPNPIGGQIVGGPSIDPGTESFVSFHPLPVQHGMTVGELAQLFQRELKLSSLDLQVVTCKGWTRETRFDRTGLYWINPSPNMRNLNEAILYPGIGLWETTNLSVGRGTDTPFEIVGAPWIDARQLAARLSALGLNGVQFTPRSFVPSSSKYAGEQCEGVQISITNRDSFDAIRCGFALGCQLHRLYPDQWQSNASSRLLCNQQILKAVQGGLGLDQIMTLIQQDVDEFKCRRAPFLLY